MTTFVAQPFAPLPAAPSEYVAERFATELFIRTCVMPSRADSLALLEEVAELDTSAAEVPDYCNHHLDRQEYVARYLWPTFDTATAATKGALRRSVDAALDRAAYAWRSEQDEAAEQAAAAATAQRLEAGDDRLARATELAAAAA